MSTLISGRHSGPSRRPPKLPADRFDGEDDVLTLHAPRRCSACGSGKMARHNVRMAADSLVGIRSIEGTAKCPDCGHSETFGFKT